MILTYNQFLPFTSSFPEFAKQILGESNLWIALESRRDSGDDVIAFTVPRRRLLVLCLLQRLPVSVFVLQAAVPRP